MPIDLATSKVGSKAIRIDVSPPEALAQRIDESAKSRQTGRSAFVAAAAKHGLHAAR